MPIIRPQKGPQEAFLSTPADICIYGGAAGGGKSYALLLEPIRHYNNPNFGAVVFRKNSTQIFSQGGLWDTAEKIYSGIGRRKRTPSPQWIFPSGAKVTFAHMENDNAVHKWQGSQIALIEFDELTHFTEKQFFYMLSRNRSDSGVRGYVRATCNPDADSWVAKFIDWWIGAEGYPIPERSGQLRWMIRRDGEIFWADTPEELWGCFELKTEEEKAEPKSVTFISSKLSDNQILVERDPGYLANLKALSLVDRERLLEGNWKIKPAAGLYFRRARVNMLEQLPNDVIKWVRAWDMAATEDKRASSPEDGPACTAGVLLGLRKNGRVIVADVINRRMNAGDVKATIKNTAVSDKAKYKHVRIRLNQDPGQAGKDQAEQYLKLLQGFSVNIERESGSKETRAEPFSAQWLGLDGDEQGNVDVLIADWNDAYFSQLESFPEGKLKDMVDASGTGYNELMNGHTTLPITQKSAQANRVNPWRV